MGVQFLLRRGEVSLPLQDCLDLLNPARLDLPAERRRPKQECHPRRKQNALMQRDRSSGHNQPLRRPQEVSVVNAKTNNSRLLKVNRMR